MTWPNLLVYLGAAVMYLLGGWLLAEVTVLLAKRPPQRKRQ